MDLTETRIRLYRETRINNTLQALGAADAEPAEYVVFCTEPTDEDAEGCEYKIPVEFVGGGRAQRPGGGFCGSYDSNDQSLPVATKSFRIPGTDDRNWDMTVTLWPVEDDSPASFISI